MIHKIVDLLAPTVSPPLCPIHNLLVIPTLPFKPPSRRSSNAPVYDLEIGIGVAHERFAQIVKTVPYMARINMSVERIKRSVGICAVHKVMHICVSKRGIVAEPDRTLCIKC